MSVSSAGGEVGWGGLFFDHIIAAAEAAATVKRSVGLHTRSNRASGLSLDPQLL